MFQLIDECSDQRARFVRVFPPRVNDLRERLRRLGNCSNRHAYAYDPNEVRAALDSLQQELDLTTAKLLRRGRHA